LLQRLQTYDAGLLRGDLLLHCRQVALVRFQFEQAVHGGFRVTRLLQHRYATEASN
jgi:hypothetical protein